MQRLLASLGTVVLLVIVGGIFIATEVDLGGGDTIASRAPVVGPTLQGLADMAGPSGGPLIAASGSLASITCGELFNIPTDEREKAMADLDHALRNADAGWEAGDGAAVAAVSCQLPDPDTSVEVAVVDFFTHADGGTDPAVSICDAYQRDHAELIRVSGSAASAQKALSQIISSENFDGLYPALVRAERELRDAAAAVADLDGETDAGRRSLKVVGESFRGLADNHRRWLGNAKSEAEWSDGPMADNVDRWFEENETLRRKIGRASRSGDMHPFPGGANCDVETL